jgi:hypothetical protein
MIENQQLSYFTILYTNDGLTHHAHMNFTKKNCVQLKLNLTALRVQPGL